MKTKEFRKRTGKSIKLALNDPKIREKMSISHKKFNEEHPEFGKVHGVRMSGQNHPLFDDTIYTFYNVNTKETFKGTRYDFRNKHQYLLKDKITLIVHKQRKQHKGWILL